MRTVRILSPTEAMHREHQRLAYAIVLIPLAITIFLLVKVVVPLMRRVIWPAFVALCRWTWSIALPAARQFSAWLVNVALPSIGQQFTRLFAAVCTRISIASRQS